MMPSWSGANGSWTADITKAADFALAAVAFLLLFMWRTPPWLVVIISAAGGAITAGRSRRGPPEMLSLADKAMLFDGDLASRIRHRVSYSISLLSSAAKYGQGRIGISFWNHCTEAGSHIEDGKHLRIVYPVQPLNDGENRRNRRQSINDVTYICLHSGKVQKSVAGNMDKCPDRRYAL
jgi:hypothetical protein